MKRNIWGRALLVSLAGALLLAGCGDKQKPSLDAQERASNTLSGEEQARFEGLTIAQIMQGPGLTGTSPSQAGFSGDGQSVYFNWNSPHRLDSLNARDPRNAYAHYHALRDDAGTWRLDVASRVVDKLSTIAADTLVPSSVVWDSAKRHRAEIRGNDLYLIDAQNGRSRRVTATLAREHGVQIARDGSRVSFVRDDNLFAVDWRGGPIEQLTDLRLSDDPDDESKASAQRQHLLDQQKELFEEISVFSDDDDEDEDDGRADAVYLGEGWEVETVQLSPSGKYVAIGLKKDPSDDRAPIVPQVVTESGYLETKETRAKVGDAPEETRVVVMPLSTYDVIEVDAPEAMWITVMSWSPTDDVLLVRGISADWHDRYFYAVKPAEKKRDRDLVLKKLDHYHDDAWVGGPDFYETGAWMPDGRSIYFISESSGWGHLYTVTLGGKSTRLTEGDWEVHSAWLDDDRGRWYITSNEGQLGSSRLWRMNLDGSTRRLLTPKEGRYICSFSSDMRRVAITYSTVVSPPELYLFDIETETISEAMTQSTTEAFRRYSWVMPELVTFKASDGEQVRAHLLKPQRFGVQSNGAGVIFIHGAGYLQNVIDWWGYYYREYMFNHYLASRGYTVLNVDYRGSAGYGQECRTAIHEHMGGRDLGDIVDGAKYLMKKHKVGKDQVGVYGGSYGGFLTLMALFKNPKEIQAGAALRSVTDWAHYNHWYTARILGTPEGNPEAYRRSSPIYFADGLEGHLLMLHGLRDSNVLVADVLRLSQRLIELGKDDWELALHPVEGHGYQRATSWTDQITRTYKLFEEVLPDGAPTRR